MLPFQTFPGRPGVSCSDARLAALAMPPLAGRRFLDIGCNEGYFCGYAFFDAAALVVGVDRDELAIGKARARFPRCTFEVVDWVDFFRENREKFDVILCADALNYAENPVAFIGALMRRLSRGGVLILETALAGANLPDISADERGLYRLRAMPDAGLFPDWGGLENLLSAYVHKYMGPCPDNPFKPLNGHVFHVRNPLPCAVLLTGAPGSGKSSAARMLFPHLPVVNGDALLIKMEAMPERYPRLAEMASRKISWQRIDLVVREIFASGALDEYIDLILAESGGRDFVFDGFIPEEQRARFAKALEANDYRVLVLHSPNPEISPNELSRRARVEARKYQLFLGAYENVRKRGG